ncbi:hypothetical protein CEXT_85381 [Caerostris extrusa]|uniref:Uncharacterized protein n=1 Tax=Caerostris extrusa TaxID=172846 RepID=A0AAV4Q917_CAEEX|nr:hypothetical protein CEXT_85381 [Caerostris extrusa]
MIFHLSAEHLKVRRDCARLRHRFSGLHTKNDLSKVQNDSTHRTGCLFEFVPECGAASNYCCGAVTLAQVTVLRLYSCIVCRNKDSSISLSRSQLCLSFIAFYAN